MMFSHLSRTKNGLAAAVTVASCLSMALIAGCGGGGGSAAGTGGTTTRAATVNLYVTDGFREDWSQVLVTLYRIEASTDNGATYTTLYDNTSGQSIDLASLGSAAQLLSSVSVPAGTITGVRVTLGDTVSITPRGGGAVQTKTVDSSLANVTVANGQAAFVFQAPTAVSAGRISNLVVDFKLAAFELISGKIRPALAKGDSTAFDAKQKVAHIGGTVSNYVAGSGFDLTPNCGQHSGRPNAGTPSTIHVTLNSTTAVTSSASSADATASLANGVSVTVEGATDATTGAVTATTVHIKDASGDDGPSGDSTTPRVAEVMGAVASLGSDGSSFALTVRDGEHIPSSNGSITVQTSATTVFLQGRTTASFASVTAGSYVSAEGTLNPTTGILVADTVVVLPAAPSGQDWPGHGGEGGH